MEGMGMMTGGSSIWRDRRVFITGCTGILGSWLTQDLVGSSADVVGLVRDGVPRSRLVQEKIIDTINVVRGEVEDFHLLERTLNEYEIETVFHLAAQPIVGTANRNALSTFDTNVRGTWNLLEACLRVDTVKQVVMASSDKAYGEQENLPYDETFPLQGSHPYDVSKSCADLIAHSYFNTYGLPVCVTRCGNFFGGGDLNFNRLVPGTIRSVIRDEAPVIRSDGTFIRDYIYIEDVALAYKMLAEKMSEDAGLHGEAFNFSCENPVNAIDLVSKMLELMGREDLEPVIQGQASNEIPRQYLNAAKAKKVLGWTPRYSLDDGLRLTIDWYKHFFSS